MSEAYLAQQPIQIWNPVRGVWEKPMASLLCEHWELFSEAWQTSGMMRNGQVFALPMPAHLTADSESSSLPQGLPTPAVNDMGRGKTVEQWDEWTDKMKSKHGNGNGHGPSLDIEVLRLMPTPTTMDAKATNNLEVTQKFLAQGKQTCLTYEVTLMPTPNTMDHLPARSAEKIAESKERTPGGYANIRETVVNDLMPTPKALDGIKGNLKTSQERIDAGHFVDLTNVAIDLAQNLPTPTASDWKGANHSGSGSASSRGMATVVEQTNWGKFEPAIKRWEAVMDRPAPAPTLPDGKEGAHRLSPWFTEWMMGLPEGWICDPEIGLTRNEQLKACGNGVVPQQAELALRILLEGSDLLVDNSVESCG